MLALQNAFTCILMALVFAPENGKAKKRLGKALKEMEKIERRKRCRSRCSHEFSLLYEPAQIAYIVHSHIERERKTHTIGKSEREKGTPTRRYSWSWATKLQTIRIWNFVTTTQSRGKCGGDSIIFAIKKNPQIKSHFQLLLFKRVSSGFHIYFLASFS